MYYSYVEIEYVATSFVPARTDLALKLLTKYVSVQIGWDRDFYGILMWFENSAPFLN